MSSILNHKCDCGQEQYISFGHPQKSFTHKWNCEKCNTKHSQFVEEWISSKGKKNDEVIYKNDSISFLHILITTDKDMKVVPVDTLQWNDFRGRRDEEQHGGWLTLEEISNQLGNRGVIYVWVESPLHGAIYQFGNYNNSDWQLYCKTPGYA